MDIDAQDLEVKNNVDANQFEIQLGDETAIITYYLKGDHIYVMLHTEVPPNYEGRGIANHLIHDSLEIVRAEGGKVVPICPSVKKYIQRHVEYQDMVTA